MTPDTGQMSSVTVYLSNILATQGSTCQAGSQGGCTSENRNNQGPLKANFLVSRGWDDSWFAREGAIGLLNNFMSYKGPGTHYSGIGRNCAWFL